jgi:hypothetical protein
VHQPVSFNSTHILIILHCVFYFYFVFILTSQQPYSYISQLHLLPWTAVETQHRIYFCFYISTAIFLIYHHYTYFPEQLQLCNIVISLCHLPIILPDHSITYNCKILLFLSN